MRKKRRGLLALLLLAAAIAWLIYDGNSRLVTTEYTLGCDTLPKPFDGMRIVQLSDTHTKRFGKDNDRLFAAVRDAKPDIIVLTGDIIDGDSAEDYAEELGEGLSSIAPVYYVSGNHEWASGWARELFDILEDSGVTVLRNAFVPLAKSGEEIAIAGVEDPNGPTGFRDPEKLVKKIRGDMGDNAFILMLSHRNTELDMWAGLGVDVVMSGHAHGGLIRLPFTDGLVAPGQGLLPTWTSGVYSKGGTRMVVSRGIGNTRGLPRLLNNPEIVVLTLERA